MALKVIGAGLGRTGTLSLKFALERLGFGPCYHMVEVMRGDESKARIDQWDAITSGETPDWDRVFDGFAATVDWPACNYYRELMTAWPDAKVILTCRDDADRWFASTQATIFANADHPPFVAWLTSAVLGADLHNREACIAAYKDYNDGVIAYVPPENLLVFRPDDGWDPLCAFLGVATPQEPFPHVNTTMQFRAVMAARAQST